MASEHEGCMRIFYDGLRSQIDEIAKLTKQRLESHVQSEFDAGYAKGWNKAMEFFEQQIKLKREKIEGGA